MHSGKFEATESSPLMLYPSRNRGRHSMKAAVSFGVLAMICAAPAIAEDDPGPNPQAEFNLVCAGAGSATRENSGGLFGEGGGVFGSFGKRDVEFQDQVNVWFNGEVGSLRMPRSMLPNIRGGKDGWFHLRNVQYDEHEITGTITVSIVNKPKLRLDRYTGAISISGKAGDYTGICEKFDPAKVQRQF